MRSEDRIKMDLTRMQFRYIISGLLVLPFAPFLYLQGQYTRYKVGRLPDASGEPTGVVPGKRGAMRVLAIGESTIAGVGVEDLSNALGGRFAEHLGERTGSSVIWHSLGVSGITVRRALDELVPRVPGEEFEVIVVALGGNDVFNFRSPLSFRNDMEMLVARLRARCPGAHIFFANVPMVRDAIALPHPLKYVLSRLAKLHHFNLIDMVSKMQGVFYFHEVKRVTDDFFSDGVHPSEKGYDLWARDMVDFFIRESRIEITEGPPD